MSKQFGILGVLVVLLAIAAPAARADVVTWTVRGTVSLFTGSTPAIPFAVAAGEQYVLTVRLDDSMPAVISGDVSSIFQGGFIEATLAFANGTIPLTFTGQGSSQQLTVTNDSYSLRPTGIVVTDSIQFSGRATPVNQFNNVLGFGGSRTEPNPPGVLTSHDFPTASEVEAFFAIASSTDFRFTSDIAGRYYAEIRGSVLSVDVSAVPLPGAGWLLLSTLGGMSMRRRASIARR